MNMCKTGAAALSYEKYISLEFILHLHKIALDGKEDTNYSKEDYKENLVPSSKSRLG